MSQELEYEAKSLVNASDFDSLLHSLDLQTLQPITQHNHYFETLTFSFRNVGSALRIREKNGTSVLTLKQPAQDGGLLETHQKLNEQEKKTAIKDGVLPSGEVMDQLQHLELGHKSIQFLGTLTTERMEVPYANGTLCLDKSIYLQKTDYEVEFEGMSMKHAQDTLIKLLEEQPISLKETPNKVARFFARKMELEG